MKENSSLWQAIMFTLFSISAGIVQIASFELMYDLIHINYWISYLVSLTLSVIWNFTFNRKFTFKSSNNIPLAMSLVFLYYLAFTPLSTLWGNAMEGAGVHGFFVTAFSMIINFVTEFLYQKFIVFRNSINSATSTDSFDIIMKTLKKN